MIRSITLDQKSVRDTLDKINRYGKEAKRKAGLQIERSCINIELGAKQKVRVKNNNLKSRIVREVFKERLYGTVGTDVKYAPYIEFGTGNLVSVPAGLEDYAIQFKGLGIRQVNLPARPFLFPSVEEERKNYIEGLKLALKP